MVLMSLLLASSGSVVYLHRYFTCTFSDIVHPPYWFLCSVCEIILPMLLMTICHCLKGTVNWPQLEFRQYCLFVLEFTLLTFITVDTKKMIQKVFASFYLAYLFYICQIRVHFRTSKYRRVWVWVCIRNICFVT